MTVSRKIRGLRWAREAENPWPRGRHTQAQLSGLRYEAAVCKALGLHRQRWFEFEDRAGHGFCSPDGLRGLAGRLLVVECKLTDCPEARAQVEGLYRPVLEAVYGREVWGFRAAKVLTKESDRPVGDPQEALLLAAIGGCPLLHFPWPAQSTFHTFNLQPLASVLRAA